MKQLFFVLLSLILASCGNEEGTAGARTGEACAQSDALAQCPPNTTGTLEAEAQSDCSSDGTLDVEVSSEMGPTGNASQGSGSGAVSQVCVGSGACRVVCALAEPCEFGVLEVSETGITCQTAPCGNGVCDSGENPENCQVDCGEMTCVIGTRRCSGDSIQECNQQGLWDMPAGCGSGQVCRDMDGTVACVDSVTCVSGTRRCSGDSVQECNQQGDWDMPTDCGSGQVCRQVEGEATCVDGDNTGDPPFDCNTVCDDLLENCIRGTAACPLLDEEEYDRHCLSRCTADPGPFMTYAGDVTNCTRAVRLNLVVDDVNGDLPFCSDEESPACDAACEACNETCDLMWSRCVDPAGHSANERQCGQPNADPGNMAFQGIDRMTFDAYCLAECAERPIPYSNYGNDPDRCADALTEYQLFECGQPVCNNDVCEYAEGRGGASRCDDDCN